MPGCGEEEEGSQTTSLGSRVLGIPVGHVEFLQAQLVVHHQEARDPLPTHPVCSGLAERVASLPFLQEQPCKRSHCGAFHPMKWLSLQQPTRKPVWQCLTKLLGFPRDTDRHNVASPVI